MKNNEERNFSEDLKKNYRRRKFSIKKTDYLDVYEGIFSMSNREDEMMREVY